MNTSLNRANTLLAFTISTLSFLTFCCYLSTALNNYTDPTEYAVTVKKMELRNFPEYRGASSTFDLGVTKFDLEADFEPLFDWNVKQVFVYLLAEYSTAKHGINQIVLWDKIITQHDSVKKVALKNEDPKYYFKDDGRGLINNPNVTLNLHWNVVPNAGHLALWPGKQAQVVAMPGTYKK